MRTTINMRCYVQKVLHTYAHVYILFLLRNLNFQGPWEIQEHYSNNAWMNENILRQSWTMFGKKNEKDMFKIMLISY